MALVKRSFSDAPLAQDDIDDFTYVYGTRSALHKDVVTLCTTDLTEKLAVAFALAQSAKLGVFEARALE